MTTGRWSRAVNRRGLIRGGVSLGALTMLTGCDARRPAAVKAALLAVSRLNDKVQALLFDPGRLAPTFPASMILRPPKFNAHCDVTDVAAVGPAGVADPPAGLDGGQAVRVGDLPNRDVLRPVESQDLLGRVRQVVRDRQGTVMVVVDIGGLPGFGRRPVAVPADAMALLGQDVEVVAFTPEQLRQFPTFSPSGTTGVPDDATLRTGLAKPSH